ncbi:hypothetical protein [Dactylosporangium sp. NPDC051541]|uniref:hypothetical protein n=1 Tax=Dactylosporangium sp. NPDC051541 TaxID=3363977 RepID=UPI0037B5B12D
MPNLRSLALEHVTLSDPQVFDQLPRSLTGLAVRGTNARVTPAIAAFTELDFLDLAGTAGLDDEAVRAIAGLPKIREVNLFECEGSFDPEPLKPFRIRSGRWRMLPYFEEPIEFVERL